MHNVDVEAVERTAARAEAEPSSVVQRVTFAGDWQASEGAPAEQRRMRRCLELFEDFCVVTQSVRSGSEVDVAVEPVAELAPSGDVRATSVSAG